MVRNEHSLCLMLCFLTGRKQDNLLTGEQKESYRLYRNDWQSRLTGEKVRVLCKGSGHSWWEVYSTYLLHEASSSRRQDRQAAGFIQFAVPPDGFDKKMRKQNILIVVHFKWLCDYRASPLSALHEWVI